MAAEDVAALRAELERREEEVSELRRRLEAAEKGRAAAAAAEEEEEELGPLPARSALTAAEILRYSRQLVLPELGVRGQLRLAGSSVLVVGCGGLGCPLAQYLAAAGVGRLGLLDPAVVEPSNLARQVLHGEARAGQPKVHSAAAALRRLNSSVEVVPYARALTPASAPDLVRRYDLVADCSDNAPTRYLVSDACVLSGRPLVSASALRLEGQLAVFHHAGGPCYRCAFPRPPPAHTVTSCADGGVLGAVPGVLGCLQALEVLKIAAGLEPAYSGRLLLFDALGGGPAGQFRCVRLKGRRPDCPACGDRPAAALLPDYGAFCGGAAPHDRRGPGLRLLEPRHRLAPDAYRSLLDRGEPHLLLDVRPPAEVDICRLPHALPVPLARLERGDEAALAALAQAVGRGRARLPPGTPFPVYVVCKLGNDSQKAVGILRDCDAPGLRPLVVKDIAGGLMAWAASVDPTFPRY
ncbi:adenylyltransferase and sulfurtransferase MOCS3 [Ornithorhynchus anatinus]|uniref:Adenylyltransferase and sulfurtransferase MOCS3 n=1 Tax=Ornithorhynchus anatinus TaxID=9258 RepID=A0A6I8P275_ORNAN|nr:adenylyltransferase and sulfurtransferase MOCS3 [Ornithorhynchus anatinus]